MMRNGSKDVWTGRAALGCWLALGMITWGACDRPSPPSRSGAATPAAGQPAASEPVGESAEAEQVLFAEGFSSDAPQEGDKDSGDKAQAAMEGARLYARHCAGCHSPRGDGRGVAAAFVFPKPRDLRAGRFRLVSTDNNVPTREDLHNVLMRGMPGSSMPPWKHLSESDREALVDHVLQIRREGAREIYVQVLKEEEGLSDEELEDEDLQQEIDDHVAQVTTPGEATVVPPLGEPTDEILAAAKATYAKFGCLQCHGVDGKGDGVQNMVDEEKYPTAPRDFTAGIFKGGHDAASLYRRIAFGMPGTPMPSSSQMTAEEMVGLVHYIRSMSTHEQREAAVLNRETIHAVRTTEVAAEPRSPAWEAIDPVQLRMVPLWWRNGEDWIVQVQAMHDGQSLAVRMAWHDATPDESALRTEAFEDATGMALYRGEAEPFLGMGDAQSPIELWYWDADRQSHTDIEAEYPRVTADVYPFSESAVESAEFDRAATQRDWQPPISLPAEAAGNPIVPRGTSAAGSGLAAAGLGSVTFRLPQNTQVVARGHWEDDRWVVVMMRPLAPEDQDQGVSLKPGDRVSASFAVWNGSAGDRNGQKLITIWQDLQLAP